MAKTLAQVVNRHKLLTLLLSGLLLRLFLSVQIYSGDVNNHIAWAKDSLTLGFTGIYEREFFFRYGALTPNYPPIPIFFFTIFYWLYNWVHQISWSVNSAVSIFPSNFIFFLEDQDTLPAFLKTPGVLADVGIAWVVFMFAQKLADNRKSRWPLIRSQAPLIGSSLILFNPAFFYNSAYWGQIEAIPLFFVLLAFYLLLYSKKFILATIFLALGLLTKQTSIVFVPIFVAAFLARHDLLKAVKALSAAVLIFWLTFVPFYTQSSYAYTQSSYAYKVGNLFLFPFLTYWNKIQLGAVSDFVTDHAFNFWALVAGLDKISDSKIFLLGLPYVFWGYTLFGVVLAVVLFTMIKNKAQPEKVLFAAGLVAFVAFLFLTRIHERHLEQALPFILLAGLKDKKILGVFLGVSLFHFLNLYHNWWAPRFPFLVDVLSTTVVINTLIILAIGSFLFLFVQYLRSSK